MPGLFPNKSAAPESFKIGDQVKWFLPGKEPSSEVGVVTQICPGIGKVWVEFQNGGNQQKDPSELLLVPPFVGQSPVTEDTGYSSYSKDISDKTYGTLRDETLKLAKKLVAKEIPADSGKTDLSAMASKVASSFATGVVERLAGDVVSCVEKGLTDIQAYQNLYPQYENICSDGFMRTAIQKIYDVKNGKKA
jgi:hypothetical protein